MEQGKSGFIQWKGTEVCMDFHCKCGEYNHYDGYFAYFIKCRGCNAVYKCSNEIEMEKVHDDDCHPLESIIFGNVDENGNIIN